MTREKALLEKRIEEDFSLNELIERYYADIFRYCLWHTADRQTAEDAAQETFLRLTRHFSSLRNRKQVRAWIYKIAANVCVDLYRKRRWEEPPGEMLYMERGYEQAEGQVDFLKLIRTLPPEQREVVILRFSQDLTMREIGKVLELPLRTVQSRLRSALKKLKTIYQQEGEGDEERVL